jgi:hypothetical protein
MFQETQQLIHRSVLPSYNPNIDHTNVSAINSLITNVNMKSTTGGYYDTPEKRGGNDATPLKGPTPLGHQPTPGINVYTHTPQRTPYENRFMRTTPAGPIQYGSFAPRSNSGSQIKNAPAGMVE